MFKVNYIERYYIFFDFKDNDVGILDSKTK